MAKRFLGRNSAQMGDGDPFADTSFGEIDPFGNDLFDSRQVGGQFAGDPFGGDSSGADIFKPLAFEGTAVEAAPQAEFAEGGRPVQQAAILPGFQERERTPEELRSMQLRREGLKTTWRDGWAGYGLSSAASFGWSIIGGVSDLLIESNIADTDHVRALSEWSGEEVDKHLDTVEVKMGKALDEHGLGGAAATAVGMALVDIGVFIATIKVSKVGKVLGVGAVKGSPVFMAGKNLQAAAKFAAFRFVTQPGDFEEKTKAAAMAAAFRATPALSGLSYSNMKAKMWDFALNTFVSFGMPGTNIDMIHNQYEDAWEQGRLTAIAEGDEENMLYHQAIATLPILTADLWFSSFTRSASATWAAESQRAGLENMSVAQQRTTMQRFLEDRVQKGDDFTTLRDDAGRPLTGNYSTSDDFIGRAPTHELLKVYTDRLEQDRAETQTREDNKRRAEYEKKAADAAAEGSVIERARDGIMSELLDDIERGRLSPTDVRKDVADRYAKVVSTKENPVTVKDIFETDAPTVRDILKHANVWGSSGKPRWQIAREVFNESRAVQARDDLLSKEDSFLAQAKKFGLERAIRDNSVYADIKAEINELAASKGASTRNFITSRADILELVEGIAAKPKGDTFAERLSRTSGPTKKPRKSKLTPEQQEMTERLARMQRDLDNRGDKATLDRAAKELERKGVDTTISFEMKYGPRKGEKLEFKPGDLLFHKDLNEWVKIDRQAEDGAYWWKEVGGDREVQLVDQTSHKFFKTAPDVKDVSDRRYMTEGGTKFVVDPVLRDGQIQVRTISGMSKVLVRKMQMDDRGEPIDKGGEAEWMGYSRYSGMTGSYSTASGQSKKAGESLDRKAFDQSGKTVGDAVSKEETVSRFIKSESIEEQVREITDKLAKDETEHVKRRLAAEIVSAAADTVEKLETKPGTVTEAVRSYLARSRSEVPSIIEGIKGEDRREIVEGDRPAPAAPKKAAPEVAPKPKAGVDSIPLMVTKLKALGYKPSDIGKMTPEKANHIINKGVFKPAEPAREAPKPAPKETPKTLNPNLTGEQIKKLRGMDIDDKIISELSKDQAKIILSPVDGRAEGPALRDDVWDSETKGAMQESGFRDSDYNKISRLDEDVQHSLREVLESDFQVEGVLNRADLDASIRVAEEMSGKGGRMREALDRMNGDDEPLNMRARDSLGKTMGLKEGETKHINTASELLREVHGGKDLRQLSREGDYYGVLAKLMERAFAGRLKDVKVELKNDPDDKNLGYYWEGDNKISINLGGATRETAVHEMLHAMTARTVSEVKAGRGTKAQGDAVRELERIQDKALNHFKTKGWTEEQLRDRFDNTFFKDDKLGPHASLQEFIARSISDPLMQSALQSMRAGNRSAFDRIKRLIKQTLGLAYHSELDNALGTVMELGRGPQGRGAETRAVRQHSRDEAIRLQKMNAPEVKRPDKWYSLRGDERAAFENAWSEYKGDTNKQKFYKKWKKTQDRQAYTERQLETQRRAKEIAAHAADKPPSDGFWTRGPTRKMMRSLKQMADNPATLLHTVSNDLRKMFSSDTSRADNEEKEVLLRAKRFMDKDDIKKVTRVAHVYDKEVFTDDANRTFGKRMGVPWTHGHTVALAARAKEAMLDSRELRDAIRSGQMDVVKSVVESRTSTPERANETLQTLADLMGVIKDGAYVRDENKNVILDPSVIRDHRHGDFHDKKVSLRGDRWMEIWDKSSAADRNFIDKVLRPLMDDIVFPALSQRYQENNNRALRGVDDYFPKARLWSPSTRELNDMLKHPDNPIHLTDGKNTLSSLDMDRMSEAQRRSYSTSPLLLKNVQTAMVEAVQHSSKYVGWSSIMNSWKAGVDASRNEFSDSLGPKGYDLLMKHLSEMEGVKDLSTSEAEKIINRFQGYAASAVLASPVVWLYQPVSVASFAVPFGADSVTWAVRNRMTKEGKDILKQIWELTPAMEWRAEGRAVETHIHDTGAEALGRQFAGAEGRLARAKKFMTAGVGKADRFAIETGLLASYRSAQKQGFTGEALIREAAERGSIAVHETQVSGERFAMSELRASKSPALRAIAFMSGATSAAYNMTTRATSDWAQTGYKTGTPEYGAFVTAVGALAVQSALIAVMKTGRDWVQRDDDDDFDEVFSNYMWRLTESAAGYAPGSGLYANAVLGSAASIMGDTQRAGQYKWLSGRGHPAARIPQSFEGFMAAERRYREASQGYRIDSKGNRVRITGRHDKMRSARFEMLKAASEMAEYATGVGVSPSWRLADGLHRNLMQ